LADFKTGDRRDASDKPLAANEILRRGGKNDKKAHILIERDETPENGYQLPRTPADTLGG